MEVSPASQCAGQRPADMKPQSSDKASLQAAGSTWCTVSSSSSSLSSSTLTQITPLNKPLNSSRKAEASSGSLANRSIREEGASSISISNEIPSFQKVGQIGRQKEIRMLNKALDDIVKSATKPIPLTAAAATTAAVHSEDGADEHNSVATTTNNDTQNVRVLALIQGPAGAGKTALAHHLASPCRKHGFFVSGRFDLSHPAEQQPFLGIVMAMTELCRQILQLPSASKDALRRKLAAGLKYGELGILAQVVPLISTIVDDEETSPATSSSDQQQKQQRSSVASRYKEYSNSLIFALRRFLQVICAHCPVVLLVDDLQWADQASLELIKMWMLDTTIAAFMIIGCYRPSANLQNTIQSLEQSKRERLIKIIRISVDYLQPDQVNELLAGMLFHSSQETSHLAEIVHKKTAGNVLVIQQLMRSMVEESILIFNSATKMWQWDIGKLESIASKPTMLHFVKEQMQTNRSAHCRLLSVAASMGTVFSKSSLLIVMQGLASLSNETITFNTTDGILAECTAKGFIQIHAPSKTSPDEIIYSFAHNQIQEAALQQFLPEEDKRSELRLRAGELLLSKLDPDELDYNIFMVANLLNKVDLPENVRMKVIKVNLAAGNRAVKYGAFMSAIEYFEHAIHHLPTQQENNLVLRNELYSSAAECAHVNCNKEQAEKYCSKVLSITACTVLKKIRAYHILVDNTTVMPEVGVENQASNGEHNAVDLCVDILDQLGFKGFPQSKFRRKWAILFGFRSLKRTARRWNSKSIENLSVSDDLVEIAIIQTLEKLHASARQIQPDLMPLSTLTVGRRLFKRGVVTSHSPISFTSLAVILGSFLGEYQAAEKFALAAIEMLKLNNKGNNTSVVQSRTIMYAHCGVLHWTNFLEDSKLPVLKAYNIGMATGDVDAATWSAFYYLRMCFFTGMPLDELDSEMSKYSKVMKDFGPTMPGGIVAQQYEETAMTWQVVMNLRGVSSHQVSLIGDAFDESKSDNLLQSEGLRVVACKIVAAGYFGDYEKGAIFAIQMHREEVATKFPGSLTLPVITFLGSLSCYILLQQQRGRQPPQQQQQHPTRAAVSSSSTSVSKKEQNECMLVAKAGRTQIKYWCKKGNPNCLHFLHTLNAEKLVLSGRYERALRNYNQALKVLEERDETLFIHDKALINERLAMCWLQLNQQYGVQNTDYTYGYFEKSISLYKKWGAIAKAQLLEATCKEAFPKRQSII